MLTTKDKEKILKSGRWGREKGKYFQKYNNKIYS